MEDGIRIVGELEGDVEHFIFPFPASPFPIA